MMRFKFPTFAANTWITVKALVPGKDGMTEKEIYTGACIFDEKSRMFLNAEKQLVQLGAKAIIEGDILPGQDIRGKVSVNGVQRLIISTHRPRNPDGTVFSTEIELA